MKRSLLILVLGLLLAACQQPQPPLSQSRPYGVGYNFWVHADSLLLQEDRPMHWCQGVAESSDSLWVVHENCLVVAAVTIISEDCVDSVWVKVARDQQTMGWTHERDLLAAASPDDPISQMIRHLAAPRLWLWLLLAALVCCSVTGVIAWRRPRLHLPVWNDIPSPAASVLLCDLLLSLFLYQLLLCTRPEAWAAFYFAPALNPFSASPLLCTFLLTLWAAVLLVFAAVSDAFKLLRGVEALFYLFALVAACLLLLCVGVHLSLFPLGLCGFLLSLLFLFRYWHHARPRYLCGRCHARLQHKGPCPYCGAIND